MKKTFLTIADLPRCKTSCVQVIRRPLMYAFNTIRSKPAKMTELKTLLKFMYNTVVSFEKANEQSTKDVEKVADSAVLTPTIKEKSKEIKETK